MLSSITKETIFDELELVERLNVNSLEYPDPDVEKLWDCCNNFTKSKKVILRTEDIVL